jgi:hypothetical protein
MYIFLRPPPRSRFWSSNFVESESGLGQSVKDLQYILWSLTQPNPTTHYCK